MKKKIFLVLTVLTMLSAVACGSKGTDANTSASKSKDTTEVQVMKLLIMKMIQIQIIQKQMKLQTRSPKKELLLLL